jgi:ubiquinone/menaquinone biosynthesis C-methylase UbiE
MEKEYDQITAFHYVAYRPSLHAQILKECLKEGDEYDLGLDVGSGTGHSTVALSHYCENVVGVEPSEEMLEQAIPHPKTEYIYYNGKEFSFPDNKFDVITFAGSLFYAKSQLLLDEVVRVAKANARVVIYDFELSLDSVLEKLNLDRTLQQKSNYDHQLNFSGLDQKNIKITKEFTNSLSLDILNEDVSHLLLSSKDNYNLLLGSFGEDHLYNKVSQKLRTIFKSGSTIIEAKTYSTVYQVFK